MEATVSNTANMRIYRIRDGITFDNVANQITESFKYEPVEFNDDGLRMQEIQQVEIRAYKRINSNTPDWVGVLRSYIQPSQFLQTIKYDFIMIVKCQSSQGKIYIFAVCAGSGYYHIANLIDYSFGISILESIFNPEINKILSVDEKGIVGDILASRRFYRRALPVAYEDDFGKYFQSISVPLPNSQFKSNFPNLAKHKGTKLRPRISFSGSSSIDVRMKLKFTELILFQRDIAELMEKETSFSFNDALTPLSVRREKDTISELYNFLFDKLSAQCLNQDFESLDFDFCHREFDAFFSSSTCQIVLPYLLNNKGKEVEPIIYDDVYSIDGPSCLSDIFDVISHTIEFREAIDKRDFISEQLRLVQVETSDADGNITTSGVIREYLQYEIEMNGLSYFLLDDKWYQLHSKFDTNLAERYLSRISRNFREHEFVHKWDTQDENTYNKLYDQQPSSFCMHPLKVDNIELFDAIVVDSPNKRVFFLYVKDGVGASIRDLTSQTLIATQIIEEEARAPEKDKLKKLYEQAVRNKYIAEPFLSMKDFLKMFTYNREYVLVMHDSNKLPRDIKQGNFESRIAKHSLIEFASTMRVNGLDFSLCCANA